MLVLSRHVDESIQIGPNVRITIVRIGPHQVKLGIDAPRDVSVVRSELLEREDNSEAHDEQ